MDTIVKAVFRSGVFVPTTTCDLPENTEVAVFVQFAGGRIDADVDAAGAVEAEIDLDGRILHGQVAIEQAEATGVFGFAGVKHAVGDAEIAGQRFFVDSARELQAHRRGC